MAIVDGKIRCPKCGEAKPLDAFDQGAIKKGSGKCKACTSVYMKAWRESQPGKQRAAYLRWRDKKGPVGMKAMGAAQRARVKATGARLGYFVKSKYGITRAQYDATEDDPNGLCAICRNPPPALKRLYVDHDHTTGIVRGLLCQHCNTALGMFRDNISRMQNAIDYIERSSLWPSALVG